MKPYLSEFDASSLREPHRSILSRYVVPRLVSSLADESIDVLVSHDLADCRAYARHHSEDPLITRLPFIDPEYHPTASKRDTLGVYLRHGGELIARICARVLWLEDTLASQLEDLSLLYDDPGSMAVPGEVVIAKSHPAAAIVKGCPIAIMTGGHTARPWRKTGCYDALQRLCRAKLLAEYFWSYAVALIEPDRSGKLGFPRYGHQLGAPGIYFVHGPDIHAYDLFVSDRPYLRGLICREEAADLSRPLVSIDETEIGAALQKRR